MARTSIAAMRETRLREDRVVYRALRIVEARVATGRVQFTSPESAGVFFRLRLGACRREHFDVAFLNRRHRLIECERLFSGSISGAQVSPRIVVQRALELNAAAVLCAHNHPSGDAEPSDADRTITKLLGSALRLVEVDLLDHLVIGASGTVSLAARGWL